MDLLDFEASELYFQRPDSSEVQALLEQASGLYGQGEAELPLLKAYLRAPQSLNVLVALNRFYYYQHRLSEALLISEKALALIAATTGLPADWRQLEIQQLQSAAGNNLTEIRLYLFTLKSLGFLHMRLEHLILSQQIFEKLMAVDHKDRIGASALLELVLQRQQQYQAQAGVAGD